MRLHVAVPLIALLFLPAPVHAEDPFVMARAVGDDQAYITTSIDQELVGILMTLCDPEGIEEGQTLLGYVREDCFELLRFEEEVGPGIGPACTMAEINIAPSLSPPVEVVPDNACIMGLGPWLVRFTDEAIRLILEQPPVQVDIE